MRRAAGVQQLCSWCADYAVQWRRASSRCAVGVHCSAMQCNAVQCSGGEGQAAAGVQVREAPVILSPPLHHLLPQNLTTIPHLDHLDLSHKRHIYFRNGTLTNTLDGIAMQLVNSEFSIALRTVQ